MTGIGATTRLLLVEDDPDTAAYVRDGLAHEGIAVTIADNGTDGLSMALGREWDVIVLDRMLPGMDGLSILTRLREAGSRAPIIFLTTMDGVSSRVGGLRGGADDYLVKPFAVRELAARIAVLLRRVGPMRHVTALRVAGIVLDLLRREVTRDGEKILLQPQEVKILEYFMRNPETILSRQMLLHYAWNVDFPVRTNIVETHISRLRDKLGHDGRQLIQTIRGAGYVMRDSDLGSIPTG
ncbi:response regulator transcription factor [Gluconacetobacter azotocaptans]|uniref:Response regulator transcription factor n=1 Tax=Gluconacetobacter azotocaptans TaxID=142834 RepID=A0A7W4JQB8_9PROT|nr:response regulator transcription factor [Gluconacetobacter azotocaptans]MBB2188948.1 response regulator transcription factor [Gluconacetobacter azotocaptans]MBM9401480.1 response regulator transcription factor [Gluconacetobacter azotocaptans]GBQ25936.1 two component response regulator [Gluconacetobacter azotocaptans DSM 13594]